MIEPVIVDVNQPAQVHAQATLRIEPASATQNFIGPLRDALKNLLPLHGESITTGYANILRPGLIIVILVFKSWGQGISGRLIDEQFASEIFDSVLQTALDAQTTPSRPHPATAPLSTDAKTISYLFTG